MARFENLEFVPGLKIDGVGNCIRPFTKHQKWVQMMPNGTFDTFQPRIDFSYGLDVEIQPKLTPRAGTGGEYTGTEQYRSLAAQP